MKMLIKTVIFMLILCLFAGIANAGFTYNFINISNNNLANAAIGENQLAVEVSQHLSSQVLFQFTNSGPYSSSITQIYFEDTFDVFSEIDSLIESAGVDFEISGNAGNLPAGNTISFVEAYKVNSESPVSHNGINPGETLSIIYNLSDGSNFNDIITSLDDRTMRIGIHVQSFPNGESESFVNDGRTPPVVPAPVAITLAGIGTVIVSWLRKKNLA